MHKSVIIGSLGRAFGVQGWLHVNSFTDPKENILKLIPWQINRNGIWQSLTIETSRHQGNDIVVKLADCSDRDIASTYTNCQIAIPRKQLPTLTKNEYYWTDLEGLKVINHENLELGIVESLFATPANDIMIVKTDMSKKQHLIPFIKNVIREVDLENRAIYIAWDKDF
jgi:16S rRNA processing protein RimM